MKILITGNMGYVGPMVVRQLRSAHPTATLVGYDMGYFAHCLTNAAVLPEALLDAQIFGDVRAIPDSVLEGVDTVVHLAAISNDPMGHEFEEVTYAVNHRASVELARRARQAGVSRFVYASSCSVYGAAGDRPRTEDSELNPLTAYAKSKIATERDIAPLAADDFIITCLRFATACGMSPRLRLDLVLNDFVACALTTRKITVLSNGTPWRPLINVKDMARAIDWAATRERSAGGRFLVVNTGSNNWNCQVRDLTQGVADAIPGVEFTFNMQAPPDRRSYQADFSLFRELAPDHQPLMDLKTTIAELREGLEAARFQDANFRESSFIRLKVLTGLRERALLNENLEWTNRSPAPTPQETAA